MEHGDGSDRRRSPRRQVTVAARVSHGSDLPCSAGWSIDVSADGVLVRLPGSGAPLGPGDRAVVSLVLDDGALHLLGRASRNVRGDDGNWYVAVEFELVEPDDRARLEALLRSTAAPPEPGAPLPVVTGPLTADQLTTAS